MTHSGCHGFSEYFRTWDIEPPGRGRIPHVISVLEFPSEQFCSLLYGSVFLRQSALPCRRLLRDRKQRACVSTILSAFSSGSLPPALFALGIVPNLRVTHGRQFT